jgi:cellulose synthase (UDP-forming)
LLSHWVDTGFDIRREIVRNRLHHPLTHSRPAIAAVISVISIAYLSYYIWWRATYTLNPDAHLFSWLVLFAESFGVINFILFTWMTRDISPTRTYQAAPTDLKVDIFIPTYNESLSILEPTLLGCQSISYPHTTYVLDDGRRAEVAKLAKAYGCEYIARTDNTHAKAGNINNALRQTKGEFIAVLDADMVPQPSFLHRTLGYFVEDPKLAFVQLPQEFYNEDSIQHHQHNGDVKLWHEQSLFFHVIQPGKNHSNSAFWTGSPSVLRRTALEAIGGVADTTITEDIHTSVRLHANGWNTLFVNEELAFGQAPLTIHAFLLQRLRWAQGTMQLYRSKESPFWMPGLNLSQRLSYFASFRAYMEAIQKFILVLTPPTILLLGIFPMQVSAFDFILHWAPYFLISMWANRSQGRGYFRYFQTEKYNLLKMVTFLQSFLALIPFKLSFKVTPKSLQGDEFAQEQTEMRIFMALLGLLLGATISGIAQLQNLILAGLPAGLVAIALIWAVFNAGILALAIEDVLTHKHQRKASRFAFAAPAKLHSLSGAQTAAAEIEDLSELGASLKIADKVLPLTGEWRLSFKTPQGETVEAPFKATGREPLGDGASEVGVQFGKLSPKHRRSLLSLLYITLPSQRARGGSQPAESQPHFQRAST